MRRRFIGFAILIVLVSIVSTSGILAQRRPRPAAAPAPAPARDVKIKYRTTTSGQTSESTTMIKGKRERSEMQYGQGMEMVNITQCDLKRTIQISESFRKYLITPMETGDGTTSTPNTSTATAPTEPVRQGGVVTYVTSAIDTGERKEMFGFTARHIKSSMTMESSPDACNPIKQRTETDGWYIDLAFGLDCNVGRSQAMASRYVPPGGCRDRINFRQVGTARTGYPLIETMTMYGPNGTAMFTTSKEVIELTTDPLDAALFDVPAGYTEAASSQELYSAPTTGAITGLPSYNPQIPDHNPNSEMAGAQTKQPGSVRVGVVSIDNKTNRPVSLESLRQRLIGGIDGNGIDAVALNATIPAEAEAEAKAKQCDYILYTDLSGMKTSAAKKLGGFLGARCGSKRRGQDRSSRRLQAISCGQHLSTASIVGDLQGGGRRSKRWRFY